MSKLKNTGMKIFIGVLIITTFFGTSTYSFAATANNKKGTMLGDVYADGKVNYQDALYVVQHVSGNRKLTKKQIKVADVSGDGAITKDDAELILMYSVEIINKFPAEINNTYGDVNGDGKIDYQDAMEALQCATGNKKLTKKQRKAADVNGNGKVDKKDATLILEYSVGKREVFPVRPYGDVNGDGKIDYIDAMEALQCATGNRKLTKKQRKAADVTGDGKIDKNDATLILRYSVGLIKNFPV